MVGLKDEDIEKIFENAVGEVITAFQEAKIRLGEDATDEQIGVVVKEILTERILDQIGNNPKKDWVTAFEE